MDEAEGRIDQIKHFYDDQTESLDDLIELFEKAPNSDDNEGQLAELLVGKKDKVFDKIKESYKALFLLYLHTSQRLF